MIKNKKKKLKEAIESYGFGEKEMTYSFDGRGGLLPKKVMNWSGVSTDEGKFYDSTEPLSLVEVNDEGKRFTTIANFIEKNWESL